MNALNVITIESPKGYMEECAHFVIDDVTKPFILNNIMKIGEEYTFSVWVKSDSEKALNVFNNPLEVTASWAKRAISFKADTKDLQIYFSDIGTYYLYHSQLEIGNVDTDWRPSPWDFNEELDENYEVLYKEITEKDTSILETVDEIVLQAMKSCVEATSFAEFKEKTETQLGVLADQISIRISQAMEEIDKVDGDLQTKLNTITKYFTFEKDGFIIGQVDNPYKVIIDNDRYSMLANDVEVMWIANGEVHAKVITITEAFKNQGYVEEMDELGRLNCRWVGGD